MRTAIAALSILAGLSLSMFALAGGPGGPGGHRGPPPPMGPLLHGLQDLDLDADQQAQLDEALETMEGERPERPVRRERPERPSEADREAHHAERKARAEALEAQLALETPDRELLHAELDDGRDGPAPQLAHDHLDLLLEVHAGLSATQRSELVETLAARRAEHAERRGDCEGKEGRGGRRGDREE